MTTTKKPKSDARDWDDIYNKINDAIKSLNTLKLGGGETNVPRSTPMPVFGKEIIAPNRVKNINVAKKVNKEKYDEVLKLLFNQNIPINDDKLWKRKSSLVPQQPTFWPQTTAR